VNIDEEIKVSQERISRSIGQHGRYAKAEIKSMGDSARAGG